MKTSKVIDQTTYAWDSCRVESGGKGRQSFDSFAVSVGGGGMMPMGAF